MVRSVPVLCASVIIHVCVVSSWVCVGCSLGLWVVVMSVRVSSSVRF